MAWFNVPFISPLAYGSSQATPTNTTPTRRFSISRQSTRFTADNPGTAFHGSSQRRTHSTDGSGNTFTDSSGNRFSGDE